MSRRGKALAAFGGLVRKEVYHILRDRRTVFVVLAMPIVQVLLFGYALQTDIEEVRLAVVDPAPEKATREATDRFAGAADYRVVATLRDVARLPGLFERGIADQAVVFGPRFGRNLRTPTGGSVLVITDAAFPLMGSRREAYARGVLAEWERELAAGAGVARTARPPRAGGASVVEARTRFWFNPTLESQHLFVPGLLAFVLTIISALMTAITVSREKETGTLEALLVSPLRPGQIILGKVVPYLGLAFLNALTTLGLAWAVFAVPVRGSLMLLLAQSFLFVVVSLALGVLISARTPSQRTAMLGVILGTLLPTAILSGMIFPIHSMPGWLQPVTHLVPAKWFIAIVRGIMLKGASLDVLWDETAVLAAMTVVILGASVRSLRPRLA